MRYEKADNLLQLALEMQAARGGLSLADIERKFGCSRRTAMRMRDAFLRNFPQAEEIASDERIKRWRLPPGVLDRLIAFNAEELADLETAVALLKRDNLPDRAASLAGLAAKLKALLRPDVARRVDPDLEALLEAEGLAMRPGPRPRVRLMVIEDLRQAIKACRKVALAYRNRRNGQMNRRVVRPYGFLFGHRHYLIAWHEHPKANRMAPFALPNIEGVEILEEGFERDPAFSLRAYAECSFGLFQEAPFDVVWRFAPEAAANARDFLFHPSQSMEEQPDGSLTVRFRAGGDLEMAWHLYTWGNQVEVLEPKNLADMVRDHRPTWPALP